VCQPRLPFTAITYCWLCCSHECSTSTPGNTDHVSSSQFSKFRVHELVLSVGWKLGSNLCCSAIQLQSDCLCTYVGGTELLCHLWRTSPRLRPSCTTLLNIQRFCNTAVALSSRQGDHILAKETVPGALIPRQILLPYSSDHDCFHIVTAHSQTLSNLASLYSGELKRYLWMTTRQAPGHNRVTPMVDCSNSCKELVELATAYQHTRPMIACSETNSKKCLAMFSGALVRYDR